MASVTAVRHPTRLAVRQCALAVSVLHDVDTLPDTLGVVLPGPPDVVVSWRECRRALAGSEPDSDAGRSRLARWLLTRRRVADRPLADLAERARPVGLPVQHPLHPGLDWVRRRVLGGALDLGLGFVGLDPQRPDDVAAVPQGVLDAAEVDAAGWWPAAEAYLAEMGTLAVQRWRRDPRQPLRPMGACDVVTLLGARTFRMAVCAASAGLHPAVVPMRTRGWLDLSRIDPAFAVTAAALTAPEDLGFPRPLLLTADEVTLVPAGGDAAGQALRDPVGGQGWARDVLYH